MSSLAKHFEIVFDFCRRYPSTGHGMPVGDPKVAQCVASLDAIAENALEILKRANWDYKVSKGAGAFPRIPWIVLGPSDIVKKAPKQGVYLAIAFAEDGSGFITGVNAATSEKSKWSNKLERVPSDWKLPIDGKKPNTKYSDAFFNPKPYYRDTYDASDFTAHLMSSASKLEQLLTTPGGPSFVLQHCPSQITSSNITQSALSKPFTILTGASGTGKTKLATSLAEYLSVDDSSNSAIVPVGSDWTDNRPVLGFVNHLRQVKDEDGDEKPVFQTTGIVDLLLRADASREIPHFLILDEMNLSHVERYFADFLSAMEQDEGKLHFHNEGPKDDDSYRLPRSEADDVGVPRSIPYPKNLFVIGTVNIDETTYMFSPKVLDRANVIEFTVDSKDFAEFLNNPKHYPQPVVAEPGVAESFLKLAKDARADNLDKLAAEPGETIAKHLHEIFLIMQAGRFEFAYRTGMEVNRYLRVCRHLAEDKSAWDSTAWKSDLDDQMLQKILPKLHGSIGRVGGLLADLALYCASGKPSETKAGKAPSSSGKINQALEKVEQPVFLRSHKKLVSMLQTLKEEQFVSFIQ